MLFLKINLLNSISKLAVNLYVYCKLKTLKKVDNVTKNRKIIVISKRDPETSLIPKKDNIFPAIGIAARSFLNEIIDIKGIIAAIEKDSKIPFKINNKIKKENCIFLFLLTKKNNLYNGLLLIENIIFRLH